MKRTTIGNDRGMSFIYWFINTFLHPVDARLNFNFFGGGIINNVKDAGYDVKNQYQDAKR